MSANPDPETACRPFTKNRDGFIMGEGSGAVILESEESALKRNAHIYCEFSGASMYDEAYNLTAPLTDGQGMVESMKLAIENAGIAPEKINYINAHGTSTGLNDAYETAAIKEVFGSNAGNIPVSSIKAAIGHTLGAGGVLEAIACIKAIESGIIPPTIHYDEPAPECDLDFLLSGFGNVDTLDLEYNRSCAVVAAGDHHTIIIRPVAHDRTALQSRVHISADSVPRFTAELTVHQVVEIVLFRRPFQHKGVTHIEERAFAGLRVRKVLLL